MGLQRSRVRASRKTVLGRIRGNRVFVNIQRRPYSVCSSNEWWSSFTLCSRHISLSQYKIPSSGSPDSEGVKGRVTPRGPGLWGRQGWMGPPSPRSRTTGGSSTTARREPRTEDRRPSRPCYSVHWVPRPLSCSGCTDYPFLWWQCRSSDKSRRVGETSVPTSFGDSKTWGGLRPTLIWVTCTTP